MKNKTTSWIIWLFALIIVMLLCIVLYPVRLSKHYFQMRAIKSSIYSQNHNAGLWPPTTDEFFSSVYGGAAQCLETGESRGCLGKLGISTITQGDSLDVLLSFTRPPSRSSKDTTCKIPLKREPAHQTMRLLTAVANGSKWWHDLLLKDQLLELFQRGFPGAPTVSMPEIAFDVPGDPAEVRKYQNWLIQNIGSERRLRDGWGRSVKMYVNEKSQPPQFVVKSAGQDGEWNTKDDIVMTRNIIP